MFTGERWLNPLLFLSFLPLGSFVSGFWNKYIFKAFPLFFSVISFRFSNMSSISFLLIYYLSSQVDTKLKLKHYFINGFLGSKTVRYGSHPRETMKTTTANARKWTHNSKVCNAEINWTNACGEQQSGGEYNIYIFFLREEGFPVFTFPHIQILFLALHLISKRKGCVRRTKRHIFEQNCWSNSISLWKYWYYLMSVCLPVSLLLSLYL